MLQGERMVYGLEVEHCLIECVGGFWQDACRR